MGSEGPREPIDPTAAGGQAGEQPLGTSEPGLTTKHTVASTQRSTQISKHTHTHIHTRLITLHTPHHIGRDNTVQQSSDETDLVC